MEKDEKNKKLKTFKEKFGNFLNKHGFYIVLFLCICIIAATAFLTSDQMQFFGDRNKTVEDNTDKSGNNTDDIDIDIIGDLDKNRNKDNDDRKLEGSDSKEDRKNDDKQTDVKNDDKQKDGKNDDKQKDGTGKNDGGKTTGEDTEKKNVNSSVPASSDKLAKSMIMPVEGKIIKNFSMDHLLYSKTLNSWSTHTGIDIAAKLGTEVKAAKKGKVESIEDDALMGIIITLDHGDEIKTVYKGLSSKKIVTEGQEVEQGQTISGIGDTATLELLDDPHLHFEVWVNGKPVNPLDYIKQ